MSFLDEVRNVKKTEKLSLEWVLAQREVALDEAAKRYLLIVKQVILNKAKESSCKKIANTCSLDKRIFGDCGYLNTLAVYDLPYRKEFAYGGCHIGTWATNLDCVLYSDLIGDHYTCSDCLHYQLKADKDTFLTPKTGNNWFALGVGVALYATLNCREESYGFLKMKTRYSYSVQFNKYTHMFVDRLTKLAAQEGIIIKGPVYHIYNCIPRLFLAEGDLYTQPERLKLERELDGINIAYEVTL